MSRSDSSSRTRRYIIQRTRLTRALDVSGARVIVLAAPAGFGKTTLARQWVTTSDRRSAWYQGAAASRDVAALATGLADAVVEILPGANQRLRDRLHVTPSTEREVDALVE